MKQGQRDWLNKGIAILLFAGSVGLIAWQGVLYLKEETQTQKPMRIQALQTTEVSGTTLSETATLQSVAAYTTDFAASSETSSQTQTQTAMATSAASASEEETQEVLFPLELNAASATELQALPGIGEVLAERIISYREQLGGFQNREQLLEVDGVGEKVFAEIYDWIYLTNESYDVESEPTAVEESAAGQQSPAQESQSAETEIQTETPMETTSSATTEPLEMPEFPLDLNTATKEDLLWIPEMTEELAEEILMFREENQYYSSAYELLYLEHMTSTYFTQIREYVEVESENP